MSTTLDNAIREAFRLATTYNEGAVVMSRDDLEETGRYYALVEGEETQKIDDFGDKIVLFINIM